MRNPTGRVNYEPNGWGPDSGPREAPADGFETYPSHEAGQQLRVRPESFADHYSQARQFYVSQTPIEQKHIGDALVFELSKVETPAIRTRMVSHLRNIDAGLAQTVADGLGLETLPEPARAAVTPRDDLPASPKLSIIENGPDTFRGRKLGILATDGADDRLLDDVIAAVHADEAGYELVAPTVGGIYGRQGAHYTAQQKIDGGPSVLYDAVAVLVSPEGAQRLADDATAKDFVTDAFNHAKFIAYTDEAMPLLEKAGIAADLDQGCVKLDTDTTPAEFIARCRGVRYWARESEVDQT